MQIEVTRDNQAYTIGFLQGAAIAVLVVGLGCGGAHPLWGLGCGFGASILAGLSLVVLRLRTAR